MPHRICPSSHGRNSSAGSTVDTSGTDANFIFIDESGGRRTASLSVVSTIAAPAFFAAAAMRVTSPALNR